MAKEVIATDKAPAAIGPYVQATKLGELVFTSGQIPLDPATMDIVVEATPDDDPEAWRDVFARMRAAGFTAWAIDNDYELEWYLRWRRPSALQRVDIMPARQQDLLFTRRAR